MMNFNPNKSMIPFPSSNRERKTIEFREGKVRYRKSKELEERERRRRRSTVIREENCQDVWLPQTREKGKRRVLKGK